MDPVVLIDVDRQSSAAQQMHVRSTATLRMAHISRDSSEESVMLRRSTLWLHNAWHSREQSRIGLISGKSTAHLSFWHSIAQLCVACKAEREEYV